MQMQDVLYFDDDARKGIIAGVNKIANAVKVTMGPGGRYVVLAQTGEQPPIVTKDGVSVAKYIKLIDPIEKMGASLIKQSSQKTVDENGDGTTTATVLAQSLVNNIEIPKNIREFKKGIAAGLEAVLEKLEERKLLDLTPELLYRIALTSANGDTTIATDVSNMATAVGKNGLINVELSELSKTVSMFEPGFKFDQGIPNSRFINKPEIGYCEFEDGLVLVVGEKIEIFDHVAHIAAYASKEKKFLLIVAPEFSEAVINSCAENCVRKLVPIIPIKAPEFGHRMLTSLEDVAIYSDGDIFSITELKYGQTDKRLGTINRIKANSKHTTLFSETAQERVMLRIKQIQNLFDEADNPHDRDKLKQRIAQLSTGFAIIKVGGQTPAEIKEKFDRYEDAVGACLAALNNGILPGAGMALAHVSNDLDLPERTNEDFYLGFQKLRDAINAPALQILENAGIESSELCETKNFNEGIDATTGELVNLIDTGIVDPFSVTVSALKSAVSIANIIYTIGCTIDSNQIKIKDE